MKDHSKEPLKLPKIKELPGWRLDTKSPTLTLQPLVLHPFTVKSKKEVNLSPRYPKELKLPRILSPAVVSRGEKAEMHLQEASIYELNLPNIRSSIVYSAFSRKSRVSRSDSQSSFNHFNLQVPSHEFSKVSPLSTPMPITHSRKSSNFKTDQLEGHSAENNENNEKNRNLSEKKITTIEKIFDVNALMNENDFKITEKIVSFDDTGNKIENFSEKEKFKIENLMRTEKSEEKKGKHLKVGEFGEDVILNQVEKISIPGIQKKHKKEAEFENRIKTEKIENSSKNNTFNLIHLHESNDSLEDTFRITDEECSEVQLGKIHYEVFRPFIKVEDTSRISEGLVLEKKLLMKKNSFQLTYSKNNFTCFDDFDDFHSMNHSKTYTSVTEDDDSKSMFSQPLRRINSVPCKDLRSKDFSDDSSENEFELKYSQNIKNPPQDLKAEANSNASFSQNLEKDQNFFLVPHENKPLEAPELEKKEENQSVIEKPSQIFENIKNIPEFKENTKDNYENNEKGLKEEKISKKVVNKDLKIKKNLNKNKSPAYPKGNKKEEKALGLGKPKKKQIQEKIKPRTQLKEDPVIKDREKQLIQEKKKFNIKSPTKGAKILQKNSAKAGKNQPEQPSADDDPVNAVQVILKKEKTAKTAREESSTSQALENISIINSKSSFNKLNAKSMKKVSRASLMSKPIVSRSKLSFNRAADMNSSLSSIINEIKRDPIKTFIQNFSVSLLETIFSFAKIAKKAKKIKKVKKEGKNVEKGGNDVFEKSQTITPSIPSSEMLSLSFTKDKFHSSATASPTPKSLLAKNLAKSVISTQNKNSYLINHPEIYSKYSSISPSYVKKSEIILPKFSNSNSFKRKEDSPSISSSSSESLEQDSSLEDSFEESSPEDSSSESLNIEDRLKSSAIYELNHLELIKTMAKSIFESNQLSQSFRPSDTFTKNISDLGENLYSVVEIDESKSKDQENPIQEISKDDLNIFGDRSPDKLIFFKDEKNQLVLNFKEKKKVANFEDEPSFDLQVQMKNKEQFLKNFEDKQKFTFAEYAVLQILPTEEFITEKLNLTENPRFQLVDKNLKIKK